MKSAKKIEQKIDILNTLDEVLHFPRSGKYGDDFENMVADDAYYLMKEYCNIVFDKEGSIVAELPIVQEVESQLNWILKRPINKAERYVKQFKARLDKSELYVIARLLSSSLRDYEPEIDWKVAEGQRHQEVDKFFNSLTDKNIRKFTKILEQIGKGLNRSKAWEWREFRDLLFRMAKEKPDLAVYMMKNSKVIKNKFLVELLDGFRKSNNWKIVDQLTNEALKAKELDLNQQVIQSLSHVAKEDVGKNLRKSDIRLLSDIINEKAIKGSGDWITHNSIMWALVSVYYFDPNKAESLIIKEINLNQKFASLFMDIISIGIIREQIDLKSWDKKHIEEILNIFVTLKDFDHDSQNILAKIAEVDFKLAFAVPIKRVEKESEDYAENAKLPMAEQYDSVPSYLDERLLELFRNDNRAVKMMKLAVDKMKKDSYPYNFRIAELCQKIGGEVYKQVLDELIKSKNDNQLRKAVELIGGIYPPSEEVCLRIIGNSQKAGWESGIWKSVRSRLYTTGVVSGEYGMRDHYIAVKESIEEISSKSKNKRIKQFSAEIIKNLSAQIKAEDKRVREELLRRKIEFEG
jgi:hypothetical protein